MGEETTTTKKIEEDQGGASAVASVSCLHYLEKKP